MHLLLKNISKLYGDLVLCIKDKERSESRYTAWLWNLRFGRWNTFISLKRARFNFDNAFRFS